MPRLAASTLLFVLLGCSVARADLLKPRATDLAAKYEPCTLVLGPTRRIVYGSYRGTLHLLESRNGALVEKQSRDLWSPVRAMVAADLDDDGQDELVGYTQNWRLFVLNGATLQDLWNTPEGRFAGITALTVADVDQDSQPELVFIADGLLRIYSGMHDIEEWKSTDQYSDTEILVGDVDGDGKDEIVLNSGIVLGALFHDLKWRYTEGFGTRMDLFDVDNDGKLEIIAQGSDGLLRVFDVDERRLKWN